MVRAWPLLILALLPVPGCTHRSQHATIPTDLDRELMAVQLRDGRTLEARFDPVRGAWRAGDGASIPDDQIAEITEESHGRGALDGLGIGVLSGGLLGAAFGLSDEDDEMDFFDYSPGEKAAIGAALLGTVGGLVGLVTGALIGSRYVYEIEGTGFLTGTTITLDAPRGSAAGVTVWF